MAEETKIPTATTPINGNTPTSNTSLSAQLIKSKLYVPTILPSLNATNPKKRFVCPIEGCNKAYGKTSHIRAHLTWHSGEKPFICEEPTCMRGFTRSDELARHIRKHTGEKPFECLQCSKRFYRSDHLTKHLGVHLKATKCNVNPMLEVSMKVEEISQDDSNALVTSTDAIGVLIKQEIDMEADHQFREEYRSEVPEIEIKTETTTETSLPAYYKSEYPTMSEAIKNLQFSIKEIKTESNHSEKRFACTSKGCGKAFKRQDELKRHSRIHSGEKPFGCEQCGKRFLRKDHLNKHRKTHFRITTVKAAS